MGGGIIDVHVSEEQRDKKWCVLFREKALNVLAVIQQQRTITRMKDSLEVAAHRHYRSVTVCRWTAGSRQRINMGQTAKGSLLQCFSE